MSYEIAPAFDGLVSLCVHGSAAKDIVSGVDLTAQGAVTATSDADGEYLQGSSTSGWMTPAALNRVSRANGATWVFRFKRATNQGQAIFGVGDGTNYEWIGLDRSRDGNPSANAIAMFVRDGSSNTANANIGSSGIVADTVATVVFQFTKSTGVMRAWKDGVLQTDFAQLSTAANPSGVNSRVSGVLQRNDVGTPSNRGTAKLYFFARIDTSDVDAESLSADPYQVVVTAGGSTPVAFTGTIPAQNATEGTPFSADLSSYFSGTETPFAYSVQAGTLPTGLTLNSSTGEITGTPTTPGTATGIVIRATDGNLDTADSNSFSIDVAAADTTAPVLTSPTGTATGQTTASGTVDTDESNGTLYWLATTNSTESASTVKGGSSQAVSATGSQSVSVTGLTAATGYYLHYVHTDAASNDSTVASSSLFTTDAVLVTTLKVLCDARAAGATSVHGAVFAAPATGDLLGAFIGEFIGAEFEAGLESGEAVLLVPVSDFGGEALTTSDTAVVVFEAVSSASSALGNAVPFGSAGVHEATIVEA